MKEKIIKILTELRPEFDFTDESFNFIEEGMLDSFDVSMRYSASRMCQELYACAKGINSDGGSFPGGAARI